MYNQCMVTYTSRLIVLVRNTPLSPGRFVLEAMRACASATSSAVVRGAVCTEYLKSRSMITVAMLTALGRQHELAVHVRGALNNGVSARELQEILLQSAIYAGAPAALEAFRTAGAVLKDAGVELD